MAETVDMIGSEVPRVSGLAVLTSAIVSLNGYTTTDVFQLMTLPTGCKVMTCQVVVVEAAGETCTVDIGDGNTADGFVANANINQTAGTVIVGAGSVLGSVVGGTTLTATCDGGTTYAAGKFYVRVTVIY